MTTRALDLAMLFPTDVPAAGEALGWSTAFRTLWQPYANLASPVFTGDPKAPTPTPGDNDTSIATTAFVQAALVGGVAGVASFNTRTGAVVLNLADVTGVGGAPLASPTFTGNPSAPTPAPSDNDTSIATTAFVANAVGSVVGGGVTSFNTRTGAVTLALADVTGVGGAPLASPALTGNPTAPTPAANDNDTSIATTAFVAGNFAPIASPTLTGVPAAPTPSPGTNTTQLATTAFVSAAVGAVPAPPAPSASNPVMDSVAAPGVAMTYARGDHVHPSDTSRAGIGVANTFTAAQTISTPNAGTALTVGSTDATAASAADIELKRSAAPVNATSRVAFQFVNSAAAMVTFGALRVVTSNITAGSETAYLDIMARSSNVLAIPLRVGTAGGLIADPATNTDKGSGTLNATALYEAGVPLAGKYQQTAPRIGTIASSAAPTPDASAHDQYNVTALAAAATFGIPAGAPADGQKLMIRIKDNGTARALAWNAIYRPAGTDVPLPATTVVSKTMYVGFIYNAADSKWDAVGSVGGI